jgi:hypothetical protein
MKQELPQKTPKYICEKCDMRTNNKKDYSRHLLTAKHRNVTLVTPKNPAACYECCGVTFANRTALWRHKKTCTLSETKAVQNVQSQPNNNDSQILPEQLPFSISNDMIYELLRELCSKRDNVIHNNTTNNTTTNNTTNHNTTTNNNINFNVFLNEYCKDAVSISDFIKSINASVENVMYMTKHGNRQGVSKIIMDALEPLDLTERPLHCTDLKRHTTYIKENDGWVKEQDQKHMKQLCNKVEHECIKTAVEIMSSNPNYRKSGTYEYEEGLKMMIETNGGAESNQSAIMKAVEEHVHVDRENISSSLLLK